MPRFAANLGFLFPEVPFAERFGAAAAAGFGAVEFAQPYELEAREIAELLEANGLEMILFNLPMGDKSAGDFGIACLPGREDEFREGVARAIAYAGVLGNERVNCIAGKAPAGADAARAARDAPRQPALRRAGDGARRPHPRSSSRSTPSTCRASSSPGPPRARRCWPRPGAPNAGLQYDIYHAAMMGEDPVEGLARFAPVIRHVQFADAPGRHEPGTGRVDIAACFARLDALGYAGWTAAEYRPSKATVETLGWLA